MKKTNWQKLFDNGRRFVLTHAPKGRRIKDWLLVRGAALALFVLVFAAASIVKVQAASVITGWLWGGGTESDGVQPWDGTNTNVGWISASRLNCDSDGNGSTDNTNYPNCPVGQSVTTSNSYGINIPDSDGPVTGYGWSENIGWVSFNAADLSGCPSGACNARREGDYLKGWARIVGIKTEYEKSFSNSGGWQGWISLSGANYGIQISKMGGSPTPTYAWSDELGWINFSRAKITKVCSLSISPASFSLGGSPRSLTVGAADPNSSIIKINFTKFDWGANPKQSAFGLSSSSCEANQNNSYSCPVDVSAVDRSQEWTTGIRASAVGCLPSDTHGTIIRLLNCTISCPDSITIPPDGEWHSYSCAVGGEAGCKVESCNKISGSSEIKVRLGAAANTCEAEAETTARYDTAISRATAGNASDDTTINVKALGWLEVAP